MHSYTATIGRNQAQTLIVNDEVRELYPVPMSEYTWVWFVEDTKADMRAVSNAFQPGVATIETHYGKGEWQDVEEESAKITLLLEEELPADHVTILRRYLTELASRYEQDAIALTIGQSELC